MSGFCGWFGDAGEAGEGALRAMAGRLPAGNGKVTLAGGSRFGIAATEGVGRTLLDSSDDVALVIHGHWRVVEPRLAGKLEGAGAAAAFVEWQREAGDEACRALAGAYALALVRTGDRPGLLAGIDRMGVGTLFWSLVKEGGLRFATTLPALAAWPGASLNTSRQSLFDYIYFHMIPSPATVYDEIARLEPGGFLAADAAGSVRVGTHERTHFSNENGSASFEESKREFRELLGTIVADAAAGEGEAGAFLSGGTDSSTVSGYLGDTSGRPARTFSIGFDQQGFDEIEYARTSSARFGTEQHEYYVTPDDIVSLVPKLAGAYGEPFGNSSVIPTYFCADLARGKGIDVMLAGDGGDELFGGNARYAKQKIFGIYDGLPGWLRHGLMEPVAERLGFADAVMPLRKFRRYVEQARVPMPERMETYNLLTWFGAGTVFEDDFLADVDQQQPARLQRRTWDETIAQTMMNRMLALDFKFTLADNDLRKVTTMCRLAGVDVRYPLMDERLVDFSARLPIDWKVKGQRLRWFFKEALADYLPPEVITKTKHGFGLPFGSWVVKHPGLHQQAFDLMGDLRHRGIVRRDFIDQLRDTWIHDTPDFYGALVWLFMILESWLARDSAASGFEATAVFNANDIQS